MWGLVCTQLALSLYNPNRLIPDEDSILVGERFLEQMAEIKGDVFMPELQWVLRRAGKTSYTLGMPAYDIFRSNLGKKNAIRDQLGREIQEAIVSGRFAAVVPGVFLKLKPYEEHYKFYRRFEYPREYVTGAVNLTRTSVYTRIDPSENKPDE